MKNVILRLKKKISKLEQQRRDCRGSGICASDFDTMRDLRHEIKGLRSALRMIQRAA